MMARYFFHLSFGQRVVPDEEGFELPNRSAACAEALAVVRELTNPEPSGGLRRWASWVLEGAGQNGRVCPPPPHPPRPPRGTPRGPLPRALPRAPPPPHAR